MILICSKFFSNSSHFVAIKIVLLIKVWQELGGKEMIGTTQIFMLSNNYDLLLNNHPL